MAERDAFGALLLSLRDAPGLLPRLKRLGGSLSMLKRLSPRQRTVLLRMTGLGGAEPLLDHLIGGDARTRRAFHGLLKDFEERPEELSDAVRGLLDPARRSQASAELVRLLEAAERGEDAPAPDEAPAEAPDDEEGPLASAAASASARAPEPAPAKPSGRDAGTEAAASTPPARPPAPPTAAPSVPSSPFPEIQATPSPRNLPPVPATPAGRAPSRPEPPSPDRSVPSRPAPTPEPASEPVDIPARPVPDESAESIEPPPHARPSGRDRPSAPDRAGEPAEPPPPTEAPTRFRGSAATGALSGAGAGAAVAAAAGRAARPEVTPEPESSPEPQPPRDPHAALRRRLDAGEDVSIEHLAAELAEDESPAWSRRRTLAVWIEDAEPAVLAVALGRILALIGDLATPSDRMWCLTTLAGRRAWDEPEWQQILAAAESPMLRRRLGHRKVSV